MSGNSDSPFLPPGIRAAFPGAVERIYLDAGVSGLLPRTAAEVAHAHIDERLAGTGNKAEYRAAVEACRTSLAALIGAHPDEIAITKNVSEALNLFASSLSIEKGRNVVLCPDLEHPNNIFLWYNLERLRGIEVRTVESRDGHISVERMAAAMDDRTALVTVPHVSFSPGFITDVRRIAEAAHDHGAVLLLDAAQSIGAIRCDVTDLGVDALGVATQKSLLGLYGVGFLFVRRALAESMTPAHVARYGMDPGTDAVETARADAGELPYAPGARRFDLGNYNYLGARTAQASLALIVTIGAETIERHVRALAARLADGLVELGLPVVGGAAGPHLAHIVTVGRTSGWHGAAVDDPALNDLYVYLTGKGVQLSVRRGGLRMAVGIYNNPEDIDRVLDLVADRASFRESV